MVFESLVSWRGNCSGLVACGTLLVCARTTLWESHSPSLCLQAVVGGLLSPEDDHSLLISQFCEYLEYDDIRYHSMQVATSIVAQATSQKPEVNS